MAIASRAMDKVYTGLVAPVPVAELEALAGGREVVAGSGAYNAIVERDVGSSIEWAERLAAQLSKRYPGEIHAFDGDGDEYHWVVTYRDGAETYNDEGLLAPELFGVPFEIA
jgi:hypothetical protein